MKRLYALLAVLFLTVFLTLSGGTARAETIDATVDGVAFASSQAFAPADGKTVHVSFSAATTLLATDHAFVLNDVVRLAKIPKGARITSYFLFLPDCDGGTNLTLDVGLTTQGQALLLNESTGGQAGATITPFIQTGVTGASPVAVVSSTPAVFNLPLVVTADDVLSIKATTASASAGAGGTIKGWVEYTMHNTGQF